MTSIIDKNQARISQPRASRLPWVVMLWSCLVTITGMWWLIVPGAYAAPSGTDDVAQGSLVALLDPTLVSTLLVVLGAVGVLIAVVGTDPRTRMPARWVIVPALTYAVLFGFVIPDMGLLIGAGYLSALVGVPALMLGIGILAIRRPAFRWVALGIVIAAAAIVVAFDVDGPAIARNGRVIAGNFPEFAASQAPVLLAFVGGLLWLGFALRAAGVRLDGTAPGPYRRPVRDWGWWVTVCAAACPMLFMLQRLTWLTPWPIALDAHDLEAEPGLRVFGLFLGVAAAGGAVLTIGLISRWGVIYPRWIPAVGGRRVSPVWPTVLASVTGIAVAVAGRTLGQSALLADTDEVDSLVKGMAVLFVVWGPLLAVAGIAYYRRRISAVRTSRLSPPARDTVE